MPEPTIDDLLEWFEGSSNYRYDLLSDLACRKAICAILEQHKNLTADLCPECGAFRWTAELEAIRAFVERVNRRMDAMIEGYQGAEHTPKDKVPSFKRCFNEEYEATMEKETSAANE